MRGSAVYYGDNKLQNENKKLLRLKFMRNLFINRFFLKVRILVTWLKAVFSKTII